MILPLTWHCDCFVICWWLMIVLWLSYLARPSMNPGDWFALTLTCPKRYQKLFSSNLSHVKKKKKNQTRHTDSILSRWMTLHPDFLSLKKVIWELSSCTSRVAHVINFATAFGNIVTKILLTSHRQNLHPFKICIECFLFLPEVQMSKLMV